MTKDINQEEKASKKEDFLNSGSALEKAAGSETSEKYELSLDGLLKAGVHFGHKKGRWNPKMKQFVFGMRNNIHIIDLEKTLEQFQKALQKVEEVLQKNGLILLVGTKRQAKDLVASVAQKAQMPYVNERWLGGTFTNFDIIKRRIKFYLDKKDLLEKGRSAGLTKLERLKMQKKLDRIEFKMGGLVGMKRLPDLVVVLDINKDDLVVKESKATGVPVIGLVDTNTDPTKVDYPIAANDDALSSLRYILGVFLKRIIEVKNRPITEDKPKEEKK